MMLGKIAVEALLHSGYEFLQKATKPDRSFAAAASDSFANRR